MSFLATKTLDLGDGNAVYTNLGQGFTDIIQFKGFDNGGNKFHKNPYWQMAFIII